MSDIQQWYYADATGQQYGPATAEELQQLAATGQITADTQVWTEGLEAYIPASQVEGLIPAAPVAQAVPAQPVHQPQINLGGPRVNPYAQPGTQPVAQPTMAGATGLGVAPQGGEYPIPLTGKANFKLYIWLFIIGVVLFVFGMAKNAMDAPTADEMLANPNALQETSNLGWIMFVIGALILLGPAIMNLIFLHKAWTLLQPGGGTISPGKAIGFLFIPIFGSIWIYIVLFKLPGEWNNIVSRYTNTVNAPRLGIGTVFCMIFIPFIGVILWASELCKAINFMVNARIMPTQTQVPTPGGMQLY